MNNGWDEIDNIIVDKKNDMLMQALEYAYKNNVDTVEMEIEFNTGRAIKATVTFDLPDKESKDGSNNN